MSWARLAMTTTPTRCRPVALAIRWALLAVPTEFGADAVAQPGEPGGDVAAINRDLGATDKARLLGSEEQHQIGAFLGQPLTMQWDRHPRGMSEIGAAILEEASLGDLSGVDRIDPDVPVRELQHRGLGETAQSPFGRGIGGIVMRGEAGSRRDISDRAPAAV